MPFRPFWNATGIHFTDGFELRIPQRHLSQQAADEMQLRFPPAEHPVLALLQAPGPYPMRSTDRHLQRYLQWAEPIRARAMAFVEARLPRPFVAAHLRVGPDWKTGTRPPRLSRRMIHSRGAPIDPTACLRIVSQHVPLSSLIRRAPTWTAFSVGSTGAASSGSPRVRSGRLQRAGGTGAPLAAYGDTCAPRCVLSEHQ